MPDRRDRPHVRSKGQSEPWSSLDGTARRAAAFASRHEGIPLDPIARGKFEPRLGHSLEHIRIHADDDAASAASSVDARAFTVGQDIAFNRNEYRLDSYDGYALLAHELTHAVQNDRAGSPTDLLKPMSSPMDQTEAEAEGAQVAAHGSQAISASAAPTAVISTARLHADEPTSNPLGRVGAVPSVVSDWLGYGEAATSTFDAKSWKGLDIVPSKLAGKGPDFGFYSDGLGAMGSGLNLLSGLDRAISGESAGFDIAKSSADLASNLGGLANIPGLEGYAGLVSAGLDVGKGAYNVVTGDVNQATEGMYDVLGGISSGVSSWGDRTGNPVLMGAGRAAGLGLKAGRSIVSTSDAISKERGYFHDDAGEAQSGSAEAADWGRSVDEFFGELPVLDQIGGIAGGLVAGAGGIANSAYSYAHRATDAIGDYLSGPSDDELIALANKGDWLGGLLGPAAEAAKARMEKKDTAQLTRALSRGGGKGLPRADLAQQFGASLSGLREQKP
jgi:hypothetical protein